MIVCFSQNDRLLSVLGFYNLRVPTKLRFKPFSTVKLILSNRAVAILIMEAALTMLLQIFGSIQF